MALRPSNTSTGHCQGKGEDGEEEGARKEEEGRSGKGTLRTLEGLSSFYDEQSVRNVLA